MNFPCFKNHRSTGRRWLPTLCALAGTLAFAGIPAVVASAAEGDVDVGGEHILTVRFPAAGMSVKQRADAITDRLTTILSNPNLKPSNIVAVPFGKSAATILVNGHLLVTVDAQTAQFNHTQPLALAQMWVKHLRHVLPKVNAKPNPNEQTPGNTGQ
jgi:hypothetical protein